MFINPKNYYFTIMKINLEDKTKFIKKFWAEHNAVLPKDFEKLSVEKINAEFLFCVFG